MVRIHSLAERPELLVPALALGSIGAEFMQHDHVGTLARARRLAKRWPEFFLVLLDDDVPVARAVGVPLVFPDAERTELPDLGWDGAILWAVEDALDERVPTTLSAVDLHVTAAHRGKGIAAAALEALGERARDQGLARLVVPVRPTGKQDHPHLPMSDYLALRRPDGSSVDPWVRTHERAGAKFVKIAPFAMTITGTLAQWENWTGAPLVPGRNVVEGALSPVLASPDQDLGIYVEPNVWFDHPLTDG